MQTFLLDGEYLARVAPGSLRPGSIRPGITVSVTHCATGKIVAEDNMFIWSGTSVCDVCVDVDFPWKLWIAFSDWGYLAYFQSLDFRGGLLRETFGKSCANDAFKAERGAWFIRSASNPQRKDSRHVDVPKRRVAVVPAGAAAAELSIDACFALADGALYGAGGASLGRFEKMVSDVHGDVALSGADGRVYYKQKGGAVRVLSARGTVVDCSRNYVLLSGGELVRSADGSPVRVLPGATRVSPDEEYVALENGELVRVSLRLRANFAEILLSKKWRKFCDADGDHALASIIVSLFTT